MKKHITLFKILRGTNSAFEHGENTLQYMPFNWTDPVVGKIYAFRDYNRAVRWAVNYPDVSLWEAEGEIFKEGHCMVCDDSDYSYSDFWLWYLASMKEDGSMYPSPPFIAHAPNGTVLCNKLQITRKLRSF